MLEQQHFGEEILLLRDRLQLARGFIADFQQLGARHGVLVLLEPLQNEFLILLLERAGSSADRRHAGFGRLLEGQGGQHGSTCTVTSSSSRSFFSRSSTASAIACASATFEVGSTAIVTSAYRTPALPCPPRERMPYARLTPATACADCLMVGAGMARSS